jgi:hypothetical protein
MAAEAHRGEGGRDRGAGTQGTREQGNKGTGTHSLALITGSIVRREGEIICKTAAGNFGVDCVGCGMGGFGTDSAGVSPVRKSEGSFDFAQDGHRRGGFWGVETGATRPT